MRDNAILELVRDRRFVRIEWLAAHFGVAPQTIRRDVRELCDQGLLRRHYGGVGPMDFASVNLDFDRRRLLHRVERKRIAAAVAGMIPDGSALTMGIGTTPCHVAEALSDHHDLLIITCNLRVAEAFAQSRDCRIVLPSGEVRNRHRDINLAGAAAQCADYRVDFAIFGVGGIDQDGSLLDFDSQEVDLRRSMIANSRESILVADQSKIGRAAPARGGMIDSVDHLVTDTHLPASLTARVVNAGVRHVVATDE